MPLSLHAANVLVGSASLTLLFVIGPFEVLIPGHGGPMNRAQFLAWRSAFNNLLEHHRAEPQDIPSSVKIAAGRCWLAIRSAVSPSGASWTW